MDPRRIGAPARFLVAASNWKRTPGRDGALFHGVQVRDLKSGHVDRFDYGADAVVEEHIVVPKPRGSDERDAWRVGDGPIAQPGLPYWLPLGFHGNFTAA